MGATNLDFFVHARIERLANVCGVRNVIYYHYLVIICVIVDVVIVDMCRVPIHDKSNPVEAGLSLVIVSCQTVPDRFHVPDTIVNLLFRNPPNLFKGVIVHPSSKETYIIKGHYMNQKILFIGTPQKETTNPVFV